MLHKSVLSIETPMTVYTNILATLQSDVMNRHVDLEFRCDVVLLTVTELPVPATQNWAQTPPHWNRGLQNSLCWEKQEHWDLLSAPVQISPSHTRSCTEQTHFGWPIFKTRTIKFEREKTKTPWQSYTPSQVPLPPYQTLRNHCTCKCERLSRNPEPKKRDN